MYFSDLFLRKIFSNEDIHIHQKDIKMTNDSLSPNLPKILITPEKPLLDQPLEIIVSQLAAHEQVTLEASCKDKDNNIWLSRAIFKANDKGVLNVVTQAPISGFYHGIDPMGLFWSMIPTDKGVSKYNALNICEVLFSVFSENKLLAQKTIDRLPASPDLEKRTICEQGVIGTLFYPKSLNGPGVIVVPGSDGGIPESMSQLLASHGYAVLALGYFGLEGLPEKLSNIPLEYFQNAMQWFKKQEQVNENKTALLGYSRGGECVLLLTATFPKEMAAVIAYTPSHLVYGDFSPDEKPAWTFNGLPTTPMPYPSYEETLNASKEGQIPFHKGTPEDPLEAISTFLYGMEKFKQNIETATIPVENIHCPMLLLTGENDKIWPATLSGNLIMERLDKKGSTIKRQHVSYPDAGHELYLFPYQPSTDLPVPFGPAWGLLGGTPEGNAHANKESWQEMLSFLKKTLQ
jgi:dienelactone hydrolase